MCIIFLVLGEKNETFKRNERCLDRIWYFAVDYDWSFNFYTTIFLVHLLKIQIKLIKT